MENKTLLETFKKKDSCVMCGEKTNQNTDDDINTRNFYVECAGQLCARCFSIIFKT